MDWAAWVSAGANVVVAVCAVIALLQYKDNSTKATKRGVAISGKNTGKISTGDK